MDMKLEVYFVVLLQALHNYVPCNSQLCNVDTTIPGADPNTVNYIQSPNYPGPYPSSQTCQYVTETTDPYTIMYSVEFESLESGSDVVNMYSVGSKKLRIYWSDSSRKRAAFVTSSTKMELFFTSDASVEFGGFSVAYIAVDRTNLPACGSSVTVTTTEVQVSYLYLREGDCTWTFNAATSGSVIEYKVLLVRGQAVWIDGATTTTITVYGDRTYQSSGSSIQLQGTTDNDFVITVKEVVPSPTTDPPTTTLPTPVVTNNICDGVVQLTANSTAQYLTSPNYPDPYSSYLVCEVLITAWSQSGSVLLEVIDIDLGNEDHLSIRDGPTVDFRMVTTPETGGNVTSTGSNFLLSFTTDSYSNLRGFKIRYTNTTTSIPTCAASYPAVDVNSTIQTVTSVNFPSTYTGNQDEYFLFVKPSETDSIVVTFTHFDLEDSSGCVHDYVKIYDGPCTDYSLLAYVCGNEAVTIADTSGLYVLMHFHTDSTVGYTGFSASVYIGTVDQTDPGDGDDGGMPVYGWVLLGIFLFLLLLAIIAIIVIVIHRKKKDDEEKTRTDSVEPTPMEKWSTLMLITDFRRRMEIGKDKGPKIKRKGLKQEAFHPAPNLTGPNVKVFMAPITGLPLPPVGTRISKGDPMSDDGDQDVPFMKTKAKKKKKKKKKSSKVAAMTDVPEKFDYRSPSSLSSLSSSSSSSSN